MPFYPFPESKHTFERGNMDHKVSLFSKASEQFFLRYSYRAVLSCGTVFFYSIQGCLTFKFEEKNSYQINTDVTLEKVLKTFFFSFPYNGQILGSRHGNWGDFYNQK